VIAGINVIYEIEIWQFGIVSYIKVLAEIKRVIGEIFAEVKSF
jgi:hypothetical protein